MKKIIKWIGYCLILPFWAGMIIMIIPCILALLIIISIITRNWNWKKMIKDASVDPFRVMPLPHTTRALDEADAIFIERIMAAFERRLMQYDKVNWKRDGF